MVYCLALAVAASIVFGRLAPRVADRARPSLALPLLTLCGVAISGCLLATVGSVAALGVGQYPEVAELGRLSAPVLQHGDPYRLPEGLAATVVLAALAARLALRTVDRGRRLLRSWRLARSLPDALAVLPTAEPVAFALPGWPGRTVLSQGLLARLDPDERRAVLTHEGVHLRDHHDLHQFGASLCAAANPFLATLPQAVALACERAADEAAAHAAGDRSVVARAIGKVTGALGRREQLVTFAMAASLVPTRVAALLDPPRPRRPVLAAVCLSLLVLALVATGWEVAGALRLAVAADAAADRLRGRG